MYPLPGSFYQHYKGNHYQVICCAKHTETDDKLVIYKCLATGTIYARPLEAFLDCATIKSPENEDMIIPRFIKESKPC